MIVAKLLLGFAEGLVMTCILVCFPTPLQADGNVANDKLDND